MKMEEMTANQVLVLMALVVRMPVQRVMDRHWGKCFEGFERTRVC